MSEVCAIQTAFLVSQGHVPKAPHCEPSRAVLCTKISLPEMETQQMGLEKMFKVKQYLQV